MSRSRIGPYVGPFIALLVILALGVGTVYAAIPNPSTNRYYACLTKKTGEVRLINYPKVKTCQKDERLVNWNAKGPTGPQGLQGPQGVQGVQGPAGAAGITKVTLTTVTKPVTLVASSSLGVVVPCPAGRVVGGGFGSITGNSGDPKLSVSTHESRPEANGWYVYVATTEAVNATAYAICMTTEPSTVIAASKVKLATKKGR